jgi:hypothetical protein
MEKEPLQDGTNQPSRKSRKRTLVLFIPIVIIGLLCVSLMAVFSGDEKMRPIYNRFPDLMNLMNIPLVDVQGKYNYKTGSFISADQDFTCNFGILTAGAQLVERSDIGIDLYFSKGYHDNFGEISIHQWHIQPSSIPVDEEGTKFVLKDAAQQLRKDDTFFSHYKNPVNFTDEYIAQTPGFYYWLIKGENDLSSSWDVPINATGSLSFITKGNIYTIMIDYAPFIIPGSQDSTPVPEIDLNGFIKNLLLDVYNDCNFK